jgi:hypothetical protein
MKDQAELPWRKAAGATRTKAMPCRNLAKIRQIVQHRSYCSWRDCRFNHREEAHGAHFLGSAKRKRFTVAIVAIVFAIGWLNL